MRDRVGSFLDFLQLVVRSPLFHASLMVLVIVLIDTTITYAQGSTGLPGGVAKGKDIKDVILAIIKFLFEDLQIYVTGALILVALYSILADPSNAKTMVVRYGFIIILYNSFPFIWEKFISFFSTTGTSTP